MTKDEALKLALRKAFQMGQDYWYHADHEFSSYHKKADAIRAKFNELVEETVEEALAQPDKNEFNPDWDTQAVLVEEMQRMAKRIEELKAQPEQEPWEKFCDSNCVWTDHHPDCKLAEQEPVALKVVKGELCYKSDADDQSFGIWCPVTPSSDLPFSADAKFYTTPPQRKPLTDEEIALIVAECASSAHRHDDFSFARAIEAAHNIKGEA